MRVNLQLLMSAVVIFHTHPFGSRAYPEQELAHPLPLGPHGVAAAAIESPQQGISAQTEATEAHEQQDESEEAETKERPSKIGKDLKQKIQEFKEVAMGYSNDVETQDKQDNKVQSMTISGDSDVPMSNVKETEESDEPKVNDEENQNDVKDTGSSKDDRHKEVNVKENQNDVKAIVPSEDRGGTRKEVNDENDAEDTMQSEEGDTDKEENENDAEDIVPPDHKDNQERHAKEFVKDNDHDVDNQVNDKKDDDKKESSLDTKEVKDNKGIDKKPPDDTGEEAEEEQKHNTSHDNKGIKEGNKGNIPTNGKKDENVDEKPQADDHNNIKPTNVQEKGDTESKKGGQENKDKASHNEENTNIDDKNNAKHDNDHKAEVTKKPVISKVTEHGTVKQKAVTKPVQTKATKHKSVKTVVTSKSTATSKPTTLLTKETPTTSVIIKSRDKESTLAVVTGQTVGGTSTLPKSKVKLKASATEDSKNADRGQQEETPPCTTSKPDQFIIDGNKQYSGSSVIAATIGGAIVGAFTVFALFYLRGKCRRYVNGDYRPVPMEYDFEMNPRFKMS